MSINATNEGIIREVIPASNYMARCYSMVHIGTVCENIMGQEKMLNKVRITWELPTELRVFKEENGLQPMVISKEYTLSMHENSNLRKDLESWRGKVFSEDEAKSFDITKLLGVPCMLNVIHKDTKSGKSYAFISGITNVPKGMECPDQINESFEFNFNDKFDFDILEKMPDFIKDKIKRSEEYKKIQNPENTDIYQDEENLNITDDLPF